MTGHLPAAALGPAHIPGLHRDPARDARRRADAHRALELLTAHAEGRLVEDDPTSPISAPRTRPVQDDLVVTQAARLLLTGRWSA